MIQARHDTGWALAWSLLLGGAARGYKRLITTSGGGHGGGREGPPSRLCSSTWSWGSYWMDQGSLELASLGPPFILISWELVSVEFSPTGSTPGPLILSDLGASPVAWIQLSQLGGYGRSLEAWSQLGLPVWLRMTARPNVDWKFTTCPEL